MTTAKRKAALISLFAGLLIMIIKFVAYWVTNSSAVLSDATESIVNVLTAGFALWIIRFASAPADSEHPYGHGKAESFSSIVEGGMILFAGLMIVKEAIFTLLNPTPLKSLDVGLVIVVFAASLNLMLGLYLKRIGKKNHSHALVASGEHVLSDVWTTVGVLIGLFLVMVTGVIWIDGLVALIIGLSLAWTGFGLVRKSVSVLLDEADPEVLMKLSKSLTEVRCPGVIDIHKVKVIRAGGFHHIDAHIVIPEFWTVVRAHEFVESFEKKLTDKYSVPAEVAFHIDPCNQKHCVHCDLRDCPIRSDPFKELKEMTTLQLTSSPK